MGAGHEPAEIVVSAPTLSRDGPVWRVGARVGAHEVHVEADEPLAVNADAFAVACLLPAAQSGATLRVEGALDRRLAGSVPAIMALARRYWGFPGAAVESRGTATRERAGQTAMFFTGGVDSFHALRKERGAIERLIFVDGFDLGLADRAAFARVRGAIEAVAAETGARAAFPRTNLRADPTFRPVGWDRTFGAALAAVAHAMAPAVAVVHVPSSAMTTNYGSTPELDPLWSSEAVAFVHRDADVPRVEKARAIADWPLAHRHLRVCFATDRGGGLNCGRCEKCVRTQTALEAVGARERFESFPRAGLRELIDGVRWVPQVNHEAWGHIRDQIRDRAIVAAVDRLLARRPTLADHARAALGPMLDRLPGGQAVKRAGRRLLRG